MGITKPQKVCFVIMGFGEKTDYETGRTLDLDATYEAIISPAVEGLGLRCVRADEIMHSGIIDTEMYEMLLRAEIVIADISTGNANAIYELGVRHGLRPNATIIMKESGGRLHFDLNHVNTFEYEHLGKDIGAREATRAIKFLSKLIEKSLDSGKPDSPVYAFIRNLQEPRLSDQEFEELLDDVEEHEENLTTLIYEGKEAKERSDFKTAVNRFKAVARIKKDDPFIIQNYALSTYKNAKPDEKQALLKSKEILEVLSPETSNDPETLGLSGAINKRLWLITSDHVFLTRAIDSYRRGYEFRGDYYNGENLALCYDYRGEIQNDKDEKTFDRMSAKKVRVKIIEVLDTLIHESTFEDRSDKKWIFATLSNCSLALDEKGDAQYYERKFHNYAPAIWEVDTFEKGKQEILKYHTI